MWKEDVGGCRGVEVRNKEKKKKKKKNNTEKDIENIKDKKDY